MTKPKIRKPGRPRKDNRGRPRITLDEKQIDIIRKLSSYRLSLDEISRIMNLSTSTLDRRIAEDKIKAKQGVKTKATNVYDAIQAGKARMKMNLMKTAEKMALSEKSSRMLIFLLKSLYNFSEKFEFEHTGLPEPQIINTITQKEIDEMTADFIKRAKDKGIKFE